MKKENANELMASENALLQMPGDSVTVIISNKLTEMPTAGKVVLINVLAARGASLSINRIVDEINRSGYCQPTRRQCGRWPLFQLTKIFQDFFLY